ncbi:MAG: hypothetical protein IPK52_00075 [Chloroflexi bacterium]|nr:hypothetical protein [Chloroflexota bacterium]
MRRPGTVSQSAPSADFTRSTSLESAAETRRKVGIPNEWPLIRKDDGTTGFVAAQFLELVSANEPPRLVRCISGGPRIAKRRASGGLSAPCCSTDRRVARATTRPNASWVRLDSGRVCAIAAWSAMWPRGLWDRREHRAGA